MLIVVKSDRNLARKLSGILTTDERPANVTVFTVAVPVESGLNSHRLESMPSSDGSALQHIGFGNFEIVKQSKLCYSQFDKNTGLKAITVIKKK